MLLGKTPNWGSALTDGGFSAGQEQPHGHPLDPIDHPEKTGRNRPAFNFRLGILVWCLVLVLCPLSRCTAAPVLGPTPCGRAHLRPTPRVSGACLGPNEGAQPAGLPPGPHLARHGERPGYLVKRAVLACSTADPGPHRHNCSPRFRFSDAPGTPFEGLISGPDLGRRFEIARISARWDPQS